MDVWSERKELKVRTLEKFRDNVTHHKTFMTISYVPSVIVCECVSQDRRELHIIGTSSTSSAMQGMIASNTVVKGDIEIDACAPDFQCMREKLFEAGEP